MKKILVVRFSAIGDVAMTVPVVHSLATQYPQHQIKVLSRPNMAALFANLPSNVSFWGVDLKGTYKGLVGLNKLFNELKAEKFDYAYRDKCVENRDFEGLEMYVLELLMQG